MVRIQKYFISFLICILIFRSDKQRSRGSHSLHHDVMDTAIHFSWFDNKVRKYKSKMRGFEEEADFCGEGAYEESSLDGGQKSAG